MNFRNTSNYEFVMSGWLYIKKRLKMKKKGKKFRSSDNFKRLGGLSVNMTSMSINMTYRVILTYTKIFICYYSKIICALGLRDQFHAYQQTLPIPMQNYVQWHLILYYPISFPGNLSWNSN